MEHEQEAVDHYTDGGYKPVQIADLIDERYRIVRKIGYGHFSTVWLTFDTHSPKHDPEFYALKISKSESVFSKATLTEISILRHISHADPNHPFAKFVCTIIDHFAVESVHGTHICLVTHCHGDNLLHLIRRSDHTGLPEKNVKRIAKQMMQGLHYLHTVCGIIHTDIKPENVLIQLAPHTVKRIAFQAVDHHRKGNPPPAEWIASCHMQTSPMLSDGNDQSSNQSIADDAWQFAEEMIRSHLNQEHYDPDPATEECEFLIKIVDFGNACPVDQHYVDLIQTLPYRSPEVVLNAGYDTKADIWSTACVVFEIATGEYLFNGMVGERWATSQDHLENVIERLGDIPLSLINRGERGKHFFTKRGRLKKNHPKRYVWLQDLLCDRYNWSPERSASFSAFLHPLLKHEPEKRLSAEAALKLPYLSDV